MGDLRKGHSAALFTMSIWGTTFIATKILLRTFSPVEILIIRFLIAFAALTIVSPRWMKLQERKHELYFLGAGLSGICLYYLLENVALTYTMASNVGVILAIAPIFTGLAAHFVMGEGERLTAGFFIGFIVAFLGIVLISFNGTRLQLNPAGDMLAVFAAMIWAVYSLCTRKIANLGYGTLQSTRRIFCYGLMFMIPVAAVTGIDFKTGDFADPVNAFCLLFLGLGASATCYVTWNYALKLIGIVKTSTYIYLGPVITVAAAAIILHEPVTVMMAAGTVLTMAGMLISEYL